MPRSLTPVLIAAALLAFGLPAPSAQAQEGRTAIHPDAESVQPLLPGMKAPAFTGRTAKNEIFAFDPDALQRPVVLTFFRGGWCPYCNLHLSELRHAEERLRDLGFDVWFMSMDRPAVLVDSLEEPDIGYTLYSDSRLEASRAFGIAFRVDDNTVERYKGAGVDLEAISGEDHHVLPAPATFLIGANGVISFAYVNPSYDVRLHPDVLLAAAEAYREDADRRLKRR